MANNHKVRAATAPSHPPCFTRTASPDAKLPASASDGRANKARHSFRTDLAYLRDDLRITVADPALGGKIGIIVMTLVAAFVGAMLACGGVF